MAVKKVIVLNSNGQLEQLQTADTAEGHVISGGLTNQLLAKNSTTDFDLKWVTQQTDWETIRDAFASEIKWESVDVALPKCTIQNILVSGTVVFQAVYIRTTTLLTGVKWYQSVQGNYTAATGNQIGLYSLSGTTLTLVASCADDGNLWKAASNAMTKKAFASTYSAAPGVYFVAALYRQSAVVQAPNLGCAPNLQGANIALADFTNFKIYGSIGGANTALPSSQVLSGVSATNIRYYLALY